MTVRTAHWGEFNDLRDFPAAIKVCCVSRSNPGFARTSRPDDDGLRVGSKSIEIIGLGRVEGLERRKLAFVFKLGSLKFDDLSCLDLTKIAALLPLQMLAQVLAPSRCGFK